jgi:hypothetical protein
LVPIVNKETSHRCEAEGSPAGRRGECFSLEQQDNLNKEENFMILENVTTDIGNCVEEVGEQIALTPEELNIISDLITEHFGTKLSEHSQYVDAISWEPEYDEETF